MSQQKFVDFIKSNNKCMLFYVDFPTSTSSIPELKRSIANLAFVPNTGAMFVMFEGYWKKSSGDVSRMFKNGLQSFNYQAITDFTENFKAPS